MNKICVTCGKEYEAKAVNQKYCNWFTCSPTQIAKSHRWRILERDGFRCAYCGASAREDGVRLHIDHVVPISRGGEDVAGNVLICCKPCNLSKGSQSMSADNERTILGEVKSRNAIRDIADNMPVDSGRKMKS